MALCARMFAVLPRLPLRKWLPAVILKLEFHNLGSLELGRNRRTGSKEQHAEYHEIFLRSPVHASTVQPEMAGSDGPTPDLSPCRPSLTMPAPSSADNKGVLNSRSRS